MKIAQREPFIIEWAAEKGLIAHTVDQALAQHGKTNEEVGELLEAIHTYEGDKKKYSEGWILDAGHRLIALEAGDVLVTLVIQCAIHRQSLDYAMNCFDANFAQSDSITLTDRAEMLGKAIKGEARTWVFAIIGILVEEVRKEIEPYGLTLDECLDAAWEKIKGRKGETVGGVFVKEGV